MSTRRIAIVMLAAVVACAGAADKPAGDARKTDAKKEAAKDGGKDAKKKDDVAACMHCGATCGLEPVCVCEPGTKKNPKVEFEVTCEPVCIPACSQQGWCLWPHAARATCTSCCAEPCDCESRVRYVKKIKKETTDEEVAIVERKVKCVCDCCAGRCAAGCCGAMPRHRPPAWWKSLTCWWPRKPAE
jgi:hypothetical protein